MAGTQTERVLELAGKAGVLRALELQPHGIARTSLSRMVRRGLLRRVGRGLYMLPEAELTPQHTLAEVSKRVPQGVVCLLSALQFHGLTTQSPFEVWLAISGKARRPRIEYPPLRLVRFSGASLQAGVEEHVVEGATVRVFSAAKTVADCFKYRSKIGLDVAIEALRDCREQDKCSSAELWGCARVCRVSRLMLPYLEAIG